MKGSTWRDLLERLHEDSFRWTLVCCNGDLEMAKDVLQDVYLKIYEGKAKYSGKSALKTWLFSVIRFTSSDWQAKLKRTFVDTSGYEMGREPEILTGIDKSDEATRFAEVMSRLSHQQREVLTLVFYHDLKLREVAAIMDLSIGTVRTHYERGKKNFAKWWLPVKTK